MLKFRDRALRDQRGSIAIITALTMVPLLLALGFGVDYALQNQRQEQLAGIADATALYPLSPTMMALSAPAAQMKAQQFWADQASLVTGASVPANTVTVTDTGQGTSILRNVTVSFSGTSTTYISGIAGFATLPIAGHASSASHLAPQINFYLMVDTSPSMAIAATQTDINKMVANTSAQGGCAFGCHESNPVSGDTTGNPTDPSTGKPGDNYFLARKLGVTLRIDLVNQAVSNLINTAVSTASKNNTVYGMSVSTMDYQIGQLFQTGNLSANQAQAVAAVGTLKQLEVAYNGCVTLSNCNAANAGNDQDSNLDLGISTLGNLNYSNYSAATGPGYRLYNPGKGTSNSGDTPQEIIFIISDGVVDAYQGGGRKMVPINTIVDNCTAIKNSGVRIAFLYLTYNPLPSNSFYNSNIAPFQSQIAPAAEACASPGLYTQVNTGGDISGALSNLFQVAVTTARLTV